MPGSFTPPTIQGAIKRQTENYNFLIPYFDAPGWGLATERNWDVIDAILFTVTGIGNVRGAWDNSTDYAAGDRVTDVTDSTLWQCVIDHVSAATDTFEADRTANPTYWRLVTNGVVPRGDWITATQYNAGEIVTDAGRTGVIAHNFTSTTSYDDDVTDGSIVTIVDVSAFQDFAVATHLADGKATFANADEFPTIDSADSFALKNTTWLQWKANIKTYTDTLYQPLSGVLTATTASFLLADETKLDAIEALADVTDAVNVGSAVAGTADKATLVDADRFMLIDSEASNVAKAPLLSRLRTWLTDWLKQPGEICCFAYDNNSSAYLDCDGAAVSRSTYAALFAAIGTTWGAGNGTTTFNVPSLGDQFLRGNSGTRAIGSGAADSIKAHSHSLTMDAVAPHTHTKSILGRYGANGQNYSELQGGAGDSGSDSQPLTTDAGGGHTPTGTVGSFGATETAPTHKVVQYRIKI